ncbi:MAG: hypothetical protein ACREOO_15690 [bacterium]
MKTKITLFAILLALSSLLIAAGMDTGGKAEKIRALQQRQKLAKPSDFGDRKLGIMDNGRMVMYYDNNGFIGDRNFTRSIEWPAGSLNYLVWQIGILFGAVTANGDTIVSESFNDVSDNQFNPEPGYDNPDYDFDLLGGPIVARSDVLESYPPRWNGLWPAFGGGTTTADELRRSGRQESYWVMRDDNDPVVSNRPPLHLEVECRLIEINDVLTQDFIFAFYKVRNNLPQSQPLTRCRFGVLMDADVPALVGAEFEDDDSNFIRDLNLAYARDSDNFYASKPELNPGHIGVKYLRSPRGADGNELGLTAWTTFEYGDMPNPGEFYLNEDGPDPAAGSFASRDHAQYGYMTPGLYMKPRFKRDVGFIMSSGEFDLAVGDSVEIGVAYIAAPDYESLLSNAQAVQTVFDNNFRIPTPPEPPAVSTAAGNEKVTLYWNAEPSESSTDQLTGREDFEGYRIYRSEDRGQTWGTPTDNIARYPNEVLPLAEYDVVNIPGQLAGVVVSHSNQISDAAIVSEGVADGSQPGDANGTDNSGFFSNDNFQIIFDSGSTFQVLNAAQGIYLNYLADYADAVGFAVFDTAWTLLADNPDASHGVYTSGAHIYVTGTFVSISDGAASPPQAGDVFSIDQRRNDAGRNVGLKHSFVDQNVPNLPKSLFNGYEYWYTVAAYDRADLVLGIPVKENLPLNLAESLNDQTAAAIPQAPGAGLVEANVDTSMAHVAGNSDVGGFALEVIDPTRVTGHRYEISFNETEAGKTYSVKDLGESGQPMVLEDQPFYDAAADNARVFDGLRVIVTDVEFNINTDRSGQTAPPGASDLTLNLDSVEPRDGANDHDFLVKFFQNPEDSAAFSYTYADWDNGTPVTAPFIVIDQATGDTLTVEILDASDGDGDATYDVAERFAIGDTPYTGSGEWEASSYIYRFAFDGSYSTGTEFTVVTNKPLTSADRYQFSTVARGYVANASDMNAIQVVPNPFVVTSGFDVSRDRHEVQFTRLPEACTIKIYTIAGELVKTIAYDRNTEGLSFARWDLKTEFGSEVAYGVYLYHVDAPAGTKMGKLAIMR